MINLPTQLRHDFLHKFLTRLFCWLVLRVFLQLVSRAPLNFHAHFFWFASFGHENFVLHAFVIVHGKVFLVFLPQAIHQEIITLMRNISTTIWHNKILDLSQEITYGISFYCSLSFPSRVRGMFHRLLELDCHNV